MNVIYRTSAPPLTESPQARLRSAAALRGGPVIAPRQLVLVIGPTGAGKTDRSRAFTGVSGAPIVVLDRVQCHREVTVGSGRPEPDGTRRIFLADRAVSEGVMSGRAAYRSLVKLSAAPGLTVLEGGSLSLLTELAGRESWRRGAEVSVEYVRAGRDHADRVHARVDLMLRGERTMLDEVRELWPDERTHTVLAGIVGYREVLAAGDPDRGFRVTGDRLARLVDEVAAAHLRYAALQTERIDALLPTIQGAGRTMNRVTA
ncbi:isopentenyl transferase family protein [Streptomyces flaveolus]|uniref:isopentenyl transferase family protein n=1 Tax=Streptomyces flaveolus TaxID=67297 RepID=UPI0034482C1D